MDPVVHLPNVRALNRALRDAPGLRFVIFIPGMEMLVKNYVHHAEYDTDKTFYWLSPLLEPGEIVLAFG